MPVEVDGIVPNVLAGLSLPEIERLEVQHGNERLPLAESFLTLPATPPTADWNSVASWRAFTASAPA